MDRFHLRTFAIASGIAFTSVAHAQDASVTDAEAKLEKWVETRQLISKERSDWEADEQILQSQVQVLEQQIESLQNEIENLEKTQQENSSEVNDLQQRRAELLRADTQLRERLTSLEEGILKAVPLLPQPLKNSISSLLSQLPDKAGETDASSGNRLVAILGLIQQAERFNDSARTVQEVRQVPGSDKRVQMPTIYWGLAIAYSVDNEGNTASVGSPDPSQGKWVFEENNDIASQVRFFIDIEQGNTDQIDFVDLPITIK